jgi:hypothetical protein
MADAFGHSLGSSILILNLPIGFKAIFNDVLGGI